MLSGRREWLSITPEPERELPRAVATLKSGGPPTPEAVERERARAEQLVVRGSRTSWLAWLDEVERLAERTPPAAADADGELATARRSALAVIRNHDALMLGLPGPGGPWGRPRGGRRERR